MHTDRCGNTSGQKCHAKGSREGINIQQFMYGDATNVEHEMYDYIGNNWSHRNSNKGIKAKFGSHTRKSFNRFTTNHRYTWNISHNRGSTAVLNLKPERWGSPLVQEMYQGEKACGKRHNNNNILHLDLTSTVWVAIPYIMQSE
jgi:hypothetical protein